MPDCSVCSVPQRPLSLGRADSSPLGACANIDDGSCCKRTPSETCSGLFHVIICESELLKASVLAPSDVAQPFDSELSVVEAFDAVPAVAETTRLQQLLDLPSALLNLSEGVSQRSQKQMVINTAHQSNCEPHPSVLYPQVPLGCDVQLPNWGWDCTATHRSHAADRTRCHSTPAQSKQMDALMTTFLLTFVVNDHHLSDLHSQ